MQNMEFQMMKIAFAQKISSVQFSWLRIFIVICTFKVFITIARHITSTNVNETQTNEIKSMYSTIPWCMLLAFQIRNDIASVFGVLGVLTCFLCLSVILYFCPFSVRLLLRISVTLCSQPSEQIFSFCMIHITSALILFLFYMETLLFVMCIAPSQKQSHCYLNKSKHILMLLFTVLKWISSVIALEQWNFRNIIRYEKCVFVASPFNKIGRNIQRQAFSFTRIFVQVDRSETRRKWSVECV